MSKEVSFNSPVRTGYSESVREKCYLLGYFSDPDSASIDKIALRQRQQFFVISAAGQPLESQMMNFFGMDKNCPSTKYLSYPYSSFTVNLSFKEKTFCLMYSFNTSSLSVVNVCVLVEEFFELICRHGLSVKVALTVVTASLTEDILLTGVLDALSDSFDFL